MQRWLPFVLAALLLTPLQCAAEELVFRGYVLQGLGRLLRNPLVLVVLSGLLFAIPHLLNPEVDGEGGIDRDAGAYQPVPDPHCPGTTTVPPERVPNHSWNKAAQAQNPGGGSNPPPSRPSSMDALPGNGDLTEDLLGEPERREVV